MGTADKRTCTGSAHDGCNVHFPIIKKTIFFWRVVSYFWVHNSNLDFRENIISDSSTCCPLRQRGGF